MCFKYARILLAAALALVATPYALGDAAVDESDSIILFKLFNFEGNTKFEIGTDVAEFPKSFDNEVSSAIVRGGTWLLYRGSDFTGDVSILEPGEYPNPTALGSNNKLSSIRPLPTPSTVSILLFQVRPNLEPC